MRCNLPIDNNELNWFIAEIARSIGKKASCSIKGFGRIVKKDEEYVFIPEKKFQQLLVTAEKYPEPVLPLNEEGKSLYAIDTIGDGGFHMSANGFYISYYKIENRVLKPVDENEISDDEFKFTGPLSFDLKTARHCPLVCLDDKWSVKKAVFQKEADREYMDTVLSGTNSNADKFLKKALKRLHDLMIDECVDDERVFVKKMECTVDVSSGLIRLSILFKLAERW